MMLTFGVIDIIGVGLFFLGVGLPLLASALVAPPDEPAAARPMA